MTPLAKKLLILLIIMIIALIVMNVFDLGADGGAEAAVLALAGADTILTR